MNMYEHAYEYANLGNAPHVCEPTVMNVWYEIIMKVR